MRSSYCLRSSQNRAPPIVRPKTFIVQAAYCVRVESLFLAMVSGMCGLRGRNFMHKENKKWL